MNTFVVFDQNISGEKDVLNIVVNVSHITAIKHIPKTDLQENAELLLTENGVTKPILILQTMAQAIEILRDKNRMIVVP